VSVRLFIHRPVSNEFRGRFRWIALAMALMWVALLGRLSQLQVLGSEDNHAIARENIIRRVTLATTRGIIRDRNGKVLAANRPSYNVYVVPSRLDMVSVWPKLAGYLGIGLDERSRLEQGVQAQTGPPRRRSGATPQSGACPAAPQQALCGEPIDHGCSNSSPNSSRTFSRAASRAFRP
jgi:penicillin-binding protein 2